MTRISKPLAVLVIAGVGLLASTMAAVALDATATTWLNVRPTPSTALDPVDTLYPDEVVTIEECNAANWCRISHPGEDGWVNADYLSPVTDPGGDPATPDCHFVLKLVPPPPSLTIECGSSGGSPPPSPSPSPSPTDEACFYDLPNYTGAPVCLPVGVYPSLPAAWDNKATSVELRGNAKVRLCERANLGPYCRDLSASEAQLGPYLDNNVSSLRVFTGSLPPLKQACFFDDTNYGGAHFCTRTGTFNTLPPAADNHASSVAVFAGATVWVCDSPNLAPIPFCRAITGNEPVLGPFLNDRISSFRVD